MSRWAIRRCSSNSCKRCMERPCGFTPARAAWRENPQRPQSKSACALPCRPATGPALFEAIESSPCTVSYVFRHVADDSEFADVGADHPDAVYPGRALPRAIHGRRLDLRRHAAFTDILDGWMARRFGSQSKIGQYLDPIADKILLTCIYVGLAIAGAVPLWIVLLIVGRDLWILLLSAVALRFTEFPQSAQAEPLGQSQHFLPDHGCGVGDGRTGLRQRLVPENFHNTARGSGDSGRCQRSRVHPARRRFFAEWHAPLARPRLAAHVDLKPGWEYP